MRVVIDTNVLVSALLHGATPRRVYDAFLDGRLTPIFSPETLAELIEVLRRPPLRVLISEADVAELLALIQRDAVFVRPRRLLRVCRDPKDDMMLAAALTGRADYLITGDRDLLVLHPFRRIHILRPADFLRTLPT